MRWSNEGAIAEQRKLIWRLRMLRGGEWAAIAWCGYLAGRQCYRHNWLSAVFFIATIAANVYLLDQNRRIRARCQSRIAQLQRGEVPA